MAEELKQGEVVTHATQPDLQMIVLGVKAGNYDDEMVVVRFYSPVLGWKVNFLNPYELERVKKKK